MLEYMRYTIVPSILVLFYSCNKVDTWWQSDAAAKLFPPPSQVSLTYTTVGNIQLSGASAYWKKDTLTITAQGPGSALKIWVLAPSIKDTTYNLDGYNGNINLFDRNGNVVGFSTGNCSLTLYQGSDGKLNVSISGMLDNLSTMPTVAPVSGNITNLGVGGFR
jgi:hypothetical protein